MRLNGPLQSWGSDSVYDYRDTDEFPTKSAVVGMIAAALGRKRDESLEDISGLEFGLRIDNPGKRITDFQITNMGEKLKTNLSYRVYLSDATFLVGLSSENHELLNEIARAISHPVFPLYLGRRSCPPSFPLYLGLRDKGLYDSLHDEEWQISDWSKKALFGFSDERRLRIIMDDKSGKGLKRDVPVSFSPFKREYEYRAYSEKEGVVMHKYNKELDFTDHDPMKELR